MYRHDKPINKRQVEKKAGENNLAYQSVSFLKRQIPFYITLIIVISSIVLTSAVIKIKNEKFYNKPEKDATISVEQKDSNILLVRETDDKLIKPILIAGAGIESNRLEPLKSAITSSLARMQQEGNLIEASVYINKLNDGEWTSVNPEKTYRPRSLVKVPILITYLKMAEKDPSVMNRKFYYNQADSTVPVQKFSHKIIQVGKLYSTKELLREMIINSDNYATILLYEHIDSLQFKELFRDLEIDYTGFGSMSYEINTLNYSKFFEALYNGTYLTKEDSEFALNLLTKTDFKEGICKDLPPDVVVAHKFGENNTDESKQLHESGIIYRGKDAYLLTIMTRGNDLNKLPDVLSNISKQVYDYMQANN